jgi:hypothetical protein
MKTIIVNIDDAAIGLMLNELKFMRMTDSYGGSALTEFTIRVLTALKNKSSEVTITATKPNNATTDGTGHVGL